MVRVELDVDPNFVKNGGNLVELRCATQRTGVPPIILDRLHLAVQYE